MKSIFYLFFILEVIACQNKKNKLDIKNKKTDTIINDSSSVINISDTLVHKDFLIPIIDSSKFIEPDIFFISDTEYNNSKIYPFFRSKKSKSNLFFVPYTDGSITTAILCRDFNMPNPCKELLISEGFNLKNTVPILINKIRSIKGIDINSKKIDFIKLYGKPDSTEIKNDIEILYWNLQMRESDSKIYDYRKLQPFLLNGLQFNVELHLKKDELFTLIYGYEVP